MKFPKTSFHLLAILCIGILTPLYAQKERIQRMPYADYRSSYLGLQVGSHVQGIRLFNSGVQDPQKGTLYAEQDAYRLGLSIGLVGGVVLQPNWELRLMPTLHIGEKRINYSDGNQFVEQISQSTSYLSLPLQVKWASSRENNIRPYVAIGPYMAINLNNKPSDLLRAKSVELGLHASLGCDLYLGFIKLSPELSYSYALSPSLRLSRPELTGDPRMSYTAAISSSRNHQITLSLHFQ